MKTEEIKHFLDEFEAAATEIEGVECWSARRLQKLFGYSNWESFKRVIIKAEEACKNAGEPVENHFSEVKKMIGNNKDAPKLLEDMALTRYACYLIVQNGDSKKEEIAFAQNYFAVQTRRAELVEQQLLTLEKAREAEKLTKTEE
ncbi:BRO family protein [Pedobacter suwonensis]|uniref:BRO family protein n=1 Tax=Pedobacter suwonensis TaxID=332999 RepID=UPI0036BCE554